MSRHVRVSLVQMRAASLPERNLETACQWIARACDDHAQVICLQELFASPYPCQAEDHCNFDFAESLDGPSVTALRQLASDKKVVIVAPIFERRGPGIFHNTAV